MIKVKEESGKADSKLNIQNTKIMASSPITSWQIDRGKNGNSDRLYFLGLQITEDVTAAMKLKDAKAMTNLDSTLKSRDITLQTKVRIVKAL